MKNDWFSPHRFRKTVEPPTAKIGCVAMIILVLFLLGLAVVLITQASSMEKSRRPRSLAQQTATMERARDLLQRVVTDIRRNGAVTPFPDNEGFIELFVEQSLSDRQAMQELINHYKP